MDMPTNYMEVFSYVNICKYGDSADIWGYMRQIWKSVLVEITHRNSSLNCVVINQRRRTDVKFEGK
jgi:hypothetical protein